MTYKQLSVFDFLPVPSDLDELPEADMVKMIGDALGVEFAYDSFYEEYAAALPKKLRLTLEYGNYFVDEWDEDGNGARFIGCGYECKSDHSGGGAPKDSVGDAIEWFKGVISRFRMTQRR